MPRRMQLHHFLSWTTLSLQFRRGREAGCIEAMVSDMGSIIRTTQVCLSRLGTVMLNGALLQSSCENRARA